MRQQDQSIEYEKILIAERNALVNGYKIEESDLTGMGFSEDMIEIWKEEEEICDVQFDGRGEKVDPHDYIYWEDDYK